MPELFSSLEPTYIDVICLKVYYYGCYVNLDGPYESAGDEVLRRGGRMSKAPVPAMLQRQVDRVPDPSRDLLNTDVPMTPAGRACQAISNGYRAAHRRAVNRVTEVSEEVEACGRCGKPRSVRFSKDLVDAFSASTGPAASTLGILRPGWPADSPSRRSGSAADRSVARRRWDRAAPAGDQRQLDLPADDN